MNDPLFVAYLIVLSIGGCWGLIRWESLGYPFRIMTVLLCFTAIHEGATRFDYLREFNNYQYWLYGTVWQCAWTLSLSSFMRATSLRSLFIFSGLGLAIVPILVVVFSAGEMLFPYEYLIWLNIFLMIGALLVFLEFLRNPSSTALHKRPEFWLTAAAFVYSGMTFFTYALMIYFNRPESTDYDIATILQYIIVFPFYMAIIYAITLNSITPNPENGK